MDKNTIFARLLLAVDQGIPDAMAELGVRYMTGDGVDKDTGKGYNLLQEAAMAGSMIAMVYLGWGGVYA